MGLLSFEIPKKIKTTEEHNNTYVADSAPPGVYVPNMSEEDRCKWKAKHIKGENERIEIRKGIGGVQLVIIVYKESFKNGQVEPNEPNREDFNLWDEYWDARDKYNDWFKGWHDDIKISMNGSLWLSNKEYKEMIQVIDEAKEIMK